MIPRFSLVRPSALPDAIAAIAAADGDAAYVAGGTELLQVMKMGLAPLRTLVDLKGISELRGIDQDERGWLRIGGGVTHREIERSALVREALPALAELETHVANVRVRNCGTIGGNLAFAEPHSDPATFLLACGAEVELAGSAGSRRLGVGEFVLGPLYTAREPDEVITAVRVPPRAPGEGRGYAKIAFFERPAASVAVRLRLEGGAIAEAVVAAGSLTETPELVTSAAEALVGAPSEPRDASAAVTAAAGAMASLDAVSDVNGSADYKRHLAGVLLRRALGDALAEAARA